MTGPSPQPARRRGFSYRKPLVALSVLILLPAIGYSVWPGLSWSTQEAGPMLHTVERGDFTHEITDRGNIESANNVEVKCEVKSKNLSGTQILEVVPEGTVVKAGDVLVKLDSSALENDRTTQLITFAKSEAGVIQTRALNEAAVIAQKEYLEGTYDQQVRAIESEIFIARENFSRAEEYARYSERLFSKGYVTALQLKADRFAVENAKNQLEIAKNKLEVLKRFTREKDIKQLQCNIDTAAAQLKAAEASHKLDTELLQLIESQIKKCVIVAPQDGQVVYANITGYRGNKEVMIAAGEMARERQVLIRLPDPTNMQVAARVSEGKIALVAAGMSATIRLDAFPDLELEGTVAKVDEFPAPSWYGSIVKEYETAIHIHGSPPGLRPGLTAEVNILIERLIDVLQVPVQAVFEHGNKYYCVVGEPHAWKAKEVQIGSTNDKFVVIRGGLQEGQQVVLNAAAYREKVDLPEIPADNGRVAARAPAQRTPGTKAQQAAAGKGGDAALTPAELAKRMFEQYDKDHDGRLSLEDLPESVRVRVPAADANQNGSIDLAEFIAFMILESRRAQAAAVTLPKPKAAP